MADDTVNIRIRARGGREAAADIGQVGKSLVSVGRAGQLASRGLGGAGKAVGGLGRTLTSWRTAFVVGGVGSGLIAAARAGVEFNASMEQNRVAFSQFLGSSRAAGRELKFLYKTAAATPFEVPQITTAARRLLAFGFNAKQANSWLSTIGDTIAGMGGGTQEIDQLVTAIGQIRSKGQLQGDELMQLSELGVVNRAKLAKDLGISTLELMSGRANISGQRALRALQKQFDNTFGGQAAKQARTFNGQLSTLHDNLNQTLGTITKPGFTVLENRVLPALGKTTDEINKTFGRKDLDLSQKIKISEADAKRNLGPLVTAGRAEFRKLHIGQALEHDFELAVPRLADAAGSAAPRIAGAFVRGWLHAGTWGKLFTAGLLLKRTGAFSLAGSLAARAFLRRYVPTVVAGETAATAAAGGAAGGTAAADAAMRALRYVPLVGAAAIGGGELGKYLGDRANARDAARRHQANMRRFRGRGEVPVTLPDGTTYWESRADARVDPNYQPRSGGRVRGPRARGAGTSITLITPVHLNRREIAKAVNDYNLDQSARGRPVSPTRTR
jgi:tape measure domain-containing protein